MHILEAVISGIVQGATEFLPISSSGHLAILHSLFGYKEPKVLEDVLLHTGTLVAILIFFWRDLIALSRNKRHLLLIIFGSVPIAVTGFLFGKEIEQFFVNIKLVGIALFVTAAWLLLAHLSSKARNSSLKTHNLTVWQALLIGISQAVALVPGISRSGATISTALLLRTERDLAFRFSFLLSVPAIIGALLYKIGDIIQIDVTGFGVMIWGSITACLIGIFALSLLKKVLIKGKLYYFSIYCFLLGLILLFV